MTASTSKPFRQLLTHPLYWQWSAALLFMRMPSIMTSFAFVLVGTYVTGNPATGGLMVTAYIISGTVFTIPGGFLLDRIGVRKGVPLLLGFAVLTLLGLTTSVVSMASPILLVGLAGLAGAFTGGPPAAMRALLSKIVPNELMISALAFDATIIEVVVVTAPLIVALMAALWPPGAVAAMAVVTAASALLVRHLTGQLGNSGEIMDKKIKSRVPTLRLRWVNKGFTFWLLVSVAFGHILGTLETGALPVSHHLGGGAGSASILIAISSLSSILSGIIFANFPHRLLLKNATFAFILIVFLTVGCIGLGLSNQWMITIIVFIIIGACTAPLMAIRSQAAEKEIPKTRKSQGFGLLNVAHTIGFALGGMLLAILPLKWMLLSGGISGGVILMLTPVLIGFSLNRKD